MRAARAVLIEAALVVVVGGALALAANALSPLGLKLSRDYFPKAAPPVNASGTSAVPAMSTNLTLASNAVPGTALTPTNPFAATLQRLQQHGLQPITDGEVAALHADALFAQGIYVFIDARDDKHYQDGHIPGAWQFDHYRAERYFPTVLPACLTAQKVVVYCTGGACEDSEFAAIMLRNAGVPPSNLFIYPGGITEWKAARRSLEAGNRNSGTLIPATP